MPRRTPWLFLTFLPLAFCLVSFPALAQDELDPIPPATDLVIATDVYFVVPIDSVASFTVTTDDTVSLVLQPMSHEALTYTVDAVTGIGATNITIAGLPASTTLHKYQDDFHNHSTITTDANGTVTYVQDVSDSHLVLIQPHTSTIYLGTSGWSDSAGNSLNDVVGAWDPATLTGTLLQDVSETIYLGTAGVTLDGDGHVCYSALGTVAILVRADDIVIQNVEIHSEKSAINVYKANDVVIQDNIILMALYQEHHFGVRAQQLSRIRISNNTIATTNPVVFIGAHDSILEHNTMEDARFGVVLEGGGTGNDFRDNYIDGFYYTFRTLGMNNSQILDNILIGGWQSVWVYHGHNNEFHGNTIDAIASGFVLSGASNNLIYENIVTARDFPFYARSSNDNLAYNNDFISTREYGPYNGLCTGNVFHLPWPTGGNYWNTYTGPDDDDDGFGDVPYVHGSMQDDLPIFRPGGWLNTIPVAEAGDDQVVECEGPSGAEIALDGSGSYDPDDDPLTYTWYEGGAELATGSQPMVTLGLGDHTLTLVVDDGNGGTDSDSVDISIVDTIAPELSPISGGPTEPIPLDTEVRLSATLMDGCCCATGVWDWGDGNTSDAVSGADAVHVYDVADVYAITLTVTDSAGNTAQERFEFVVVYDPDVGFVTGGGWIESPAGAYPEDLSLIGSAHFGFVSKYKKGRSIPEGNTQFSLQSADLNFHSTSYQWLGISGANAMYLGSGTINGEGNYSFRLTAHDGDMDGGDGEDRFRLKIWDLANGTVVYDNEDARDDKAEPVTLLSGGSIVIHEGRRGSKHPGSPASAASVILDQNVPNPFNPSTSIRFHLPNGGPYELSIYAVSGRLVRRYTGTAAPGTVAIVWDGNDASGRAASSGSYYYQLRAVGQTMTKRMTLVR